MCKVRDCGVGCGVWDEVCKRCLNVYYPASGVGGVCTILRQPMQQQGFAVQ